MIAPFAGARIETSNRRCKTGMQAIAPSRGRGLKLVQLVHTSTPSFIAPSRGCGLKLYVLPETHPGDASPLHGARIETAGQLISPQVRSIAPFTGARIETSPPVSLRSGLRIAPFAGAWIETGPPSSPASGTISPPSRGRGLKRLPGTMGRIPLYRPFTGRGLKLRQHRDGPAEVHIAPSWGRGLKLVK